VAITSKREGRLSRSVAVAQVVNAPVERRVAVERFLARHRRELPGVQGALGDLPPGEPVSLHVDPFTALRFLRSTLLTESFAISRELTSLTA
jgi:hypothetical protein